MNEIEYIENKIDFNNTVNDLTSVIDDMTTTTIATECSDDINDLPVALAMLTGYDISTESSDIDTYKERLKVIDSSLSAIAFKKFKKFQPLNSKISEYNTAKLKELKNNITSGKLVVNPNLNADKVKSFSKKLGVFYATGYKLDSSNNGLIEFISGLSSLVKRNSKYLNGIEKMYTALKDTANPNSLLKMNKLHNVKYTLVGTKEATTRKIKFTDYRFSIVTKWITANPTLLTVKYHNRTGIKVSVDNYLYVGNDSIAIAKDKDTISLLDVGISNSNTLEEAYSGLGRAIKFYSKYRLDILLSSNKNRYKIAKYLEHSIRTLINLYSDISIMDDLIISYVNLTYIKGN